MTAVELRHKLGELKSLPVPVKDWEVEQGLDSTNERAFWVWAYLSDDVQFSDQNVLGPLRKAIRRAVAEIAGADGDWVYIRFRGVSERAVC